MRAPQDPMPSELPPTSWSLLGTAALGGADGDTARERFVGRYYEPVLAYLTSLAGARDLAEDLTQSFFAGRILEGPLLARADRSLGSFRCYLKRAARNFFLDVTRRDRRLKRGGGGGPLPLEAAEHAPDTAESSEPERAFHSAWVRALLREALERVREGCRARGQLAHFDLFVGRYVPDRHPAPSWAVLGAEWGLDEKTARGRAETVARRFRTVLREMLAVELGAARAVDEELAIMRAVLVGREP